jgi:hypothetical protein
VSSLKKANSSARENKDFESTTYLPMIRRVTPKEKKESFAGDISAE